MNIEIKFENGRIVPYLGQQEITMNVSPFLIFLATAGMCSAVYVQAFMSQRGMLVMALYWSHSVRMK